DGNRRNCGNFIPLAALAGNNCSAKEPRRRSRESQGPRCATIRYLASQLRMFGRKACNRKERNEKRQGTQASSREESSRRPLRSFLELFGSRLFNQGAGFNCSFALSIPYSSHPVST